MLPNPTRLHSFLHQICFCIRKLTVTILVACMAMVARKKREAGAGKLFPAFASNLGVTGKRLLRRVLLTLGLAVGVVVFLAGVQAEATPIRPNIRKLVTQPQEDATAVSMPARAGWDGPEMASSRQKEASLESFSSERLARAERAELITAVTPDPRAILSIMAVIFLLRLLRRQDEKLPKPQVVAAQPMENTQNRIAA